MIESFKRNKQYTSNFQWAKDIKFLNKEIKLKPGLNIVFGPNGSGKSTLIDMMASQLFAKQSGKSAVTASAINDLQGSTFKDTNELPCILKHDGQPILYVDPRQEVGLISGHFDDDFFSEGFASLQLRKISTGQRTSKRMGEVIDTLMEGDPNLPKDQKLNSAFPKEVNWKLKKSNVNDVWSKRLDYAEACLKGNIKAGQKTILLDEPEVGLSLIWQSGLWRNVLTSKLASRYQIIVATHSPFALNIEGANYIDVEPNYREQCLQALRETLI